MVQVILVAVGPIFVAVVSSSSCSFLARSSTWPHRGLCRRLDDLGGVSSSSSPLSRRCRCHVADVADSEEVATYRVETWRRELWGLFFVMVLDEILAHFFDGLLSGSEEYVSMY